MSEEKKESVTDRKISRRSALKLTGAIAAAIAAGAVGGYEANKPTLSGRQAVTITETSIIKTTVTSASSTARRYKCCGRRFTPPNQSTWLEGSKSEN